MSNKDITAVITSFKSETKILNCIKSLGKDIKIVVIENSNDEMLKEKLEKDYHNLKCVLSNENLGYAKGNNLGLSLVDTKYALIINPDVNITSEIFEAFTPSIVRINAAARNAEIAAVGWRRRAAALQRREARAVPAAARRGRARRWRCIWVRRGARRGLAPR